MENLIYIAAGLLLLFLGLYLIKYLFIGAVYLFAWAGDQGFIGFAVYFACWVFLFPLMLVVSIIAGAAISWSSS